jgi:Tol biopolymer transport system component
VFVVHPDGSGLRQIRLDTGPGRYSAYQPAWSPDGTQIVLRVFLATGEQHLYTVRPAGSDLRQVANTQGSDQFADWGPHPLASPKGQLRYAPTP